MRAAGRRAGQRRGPLRARHRRPRPARDQPRGARGGAGAAGAREGRSASSTASGSAPARPEHRAVVEGDGTSAAIAAASVIAKVTRDRYMQRAGATYPGWGFDENVGYSTPEHREAIARIGISTLHRRSFQSVAYSAARARRPSS